jgi:hypothetical protein
MHRKEAMVMTEKRSKEKKSDNNKEKRKILT